ncbi:MAG: peptidoglycan-binding protein, partial [bacterium]|nr:peptidoglycan-binding protein [bacterium]
MLKISKGLVVLAAVALVLGVAVLPAPASAQTAAELQALITTLQNQIAALTSQLSGNPASAPVSTSFTRDLKMGSVGADVMDLQKFLNFKGFTVSTSGAGAPGQETTYFGSRTRAALAAFQAANGINPPAGYFGPITRAAIAAMSGPVVVIPGPVFPVSIPGCGPGAAYSSTTGQPCTGPVVVVPGQGTEGLITTILAGEPANDANIRKTTDVPVYGIEVKAVGSDMTLDRVDLQFSVTPSGGSAQNPSSFITGISAWDGSTKLMEKSLSSSDFSKDSSNRYHVIVSGIGFKVSKDATKTVVFKINTISVSSTDSARALTVQGYAGTSQNVRAVDTLGLNSYTDMSGSSNTRSHTFNSPGTSTLTTSVNNQLTPKSQNNKVSTTDGVQKLTMQVFDVKSTTAASVMTDVGVRVNGTTTTVLPTTLFLFDGSTLLGSVTAPTTLAGTATFTNLKVAVAQDATKSLTVKATYPTSVTNGLAASTSINAPGNILYDKPDGSSGNGGPSSAIAGKDQYFFAAAPQWSLVSASNTVTAGVASIASSTLTGKITLKVHGDGGSLTKPTASDFSVVFASSTQSDPSSYAAANSIS